MKSIKVVAFFFFFLLCVVPAMAEEPLNYEIESAGSGTQGTYLVKVWVISKKNKPDLNVIQKCAVHGVLFRGFSNKELRSAQKPLAGSALAEQSHMDFFTAFFKDNGPYRNYVTMVSPTYEIIKMAKKQYRIGATFTVQKDQLRKDLTDAGILKGLNSGF